MNGSYALLVAFTALMLFVNGFTDAPNAITGAVCAKALSFRAAAALAAACNTAGLLLAWRFAPLVSNTICEMADFSRADNRTAVAALTSAMIAVVAFALAAWLFGIPTSESHALIASLTGAAFAVGGAGAVSLPAWIKVLWGLALSSLGGFAAGFALCRPWRRAPAAGGRPAARAATVGGAVFLALMHGAQDGLKFVGVLVLAEGLRAGEGLRTGAMDLSGALAPVLFCAVSISLGTLCGGRRIVKAVGERMVALGQRSGAASDLAASLLLLLATGTGLPMSTTHTKTCAVLGAGCASGEGVDWRTAAHMALAWAVTFPVCGAIGWGMTRLLLR